VKTEKPRAVAGGEGECRDDVAGLLVRERRSLDILPVKKGKLPASEVPAARRWWVVVRIYDVGVC